jgi:sugar phosphate isomerase/epimerase
MRAGRFHLTYCSNIHPGETWREVQRNLASSLPAVRRHLAHEGPLGVGLRLSAAAAEALDAPGELERFRAFLAAGDYYVFTINGFPYGAFHGTRVKEAVYLPDWRDERRLEYSNRLARLLAALLPPGLDGTVSTVPGAFKPALRGPDDVRRMTELLLRHAAELVDLRERTGRTIMLALEPEPSCFLETTAETVDFFRSWLFNPVVLRRAEDALRRPVKVEDVRRHIGVCYDACHMAVQFEDAASSIADLTDAGVRIGKIQVSAGLRVGFEGRCAAVRASLAPFAEDTYLHQVVERGDAGLSRFVDLPEALDACRDEGRREWRVHFHLPVYLETAPGLETTHEQLEALLALARRDGFCQYLEVETYTWSVLAPELRSADLPAAIARELAWVRERVR